MSYCIRCKRKFLTPYTTGLCLACTGNDDDGNTFAEDLEVSETIDILDQIDLVYAESYKEPSSFYTKLMQEQFDELAIGR